MSIRLQALPALVDAWNATVDAAAAEGIAIDVADFGGTRTEADTAQILGYKQADYDAYAAAAAAAGRTPLPITGGWDNGGSRPIAQYGRSFHNYGAARDYRILARPSNLSDAAAVDRVADLAEANGLRSGRSFGDPQHLELPVSIDDAAALWADYSSSSGAGRSIAIGVLFLAIGVGVVALAAGGRGLRDWR